MAIYASNLLDNAGSSLFITTSIAKNLLVGSRVSITELLTEQDAEYIVINRALTVQQRSISNTVYDAIVRARRQVMQHIYAFKYLVYHFVVRGEELSEGLLKETHRILTDGIHAENSDKDDSETFGGMYRSERVSWKFYPFAHPDDIRKRIGEMIQAFNFEVEEAKKKGYLDPYALAAKYFHAINNIHPFLERNGSLCRLFLNAVLLKYIGIAIPIGRHPLEAEKWNETVTRASVKEWLNGEERGKKAAWAEIATLIAIQGTATLEALMESLQATEESGGDEEGEECKSLADYQWGILPEAEEEEDWECVSAIGSETYGGISAIVKE